MFDFLVSYSIHDFVKDLLKKKFPSSNLKQQIFDAGDKLNFACPFCGDSKKDPKKKRGNLYLTTHTYKCYNDGCGAKADLTGFVSAFAGKYSLGIPSIANEKPKFELLTRSKKRGSMFEKFISLNAGSQLMKLTELAERFSLKPCSEAKSGSAVYDFIESRNLDVLPDFNKIAYFDSNDDKVFLFNIDYKSDRVLGFAIRRLGESYGPKYLIKNYAEFNKNGLIKGMSPEVIHEVDSLNNYFNILNVDFTKDVIVTEGQIDSLFIFNCVATTGVSKSGLLLENLLTKRNAKIFFDNDLAGKRQSIELIKKGYSVFLWSKFISDLAKTYSSNRIEIKLIKDINDAYSMLVKIDKKTSIESFNVLINKYFSDSELDMLFI
jgi:hypothetical protein